MNNMTKLSPIALFVYNRLWHVQQTLIALQKNELANKSELIIFSDGPKDDNSKSKVNELRDFLKTINGFKNIVIIENQNNLGLAKSIITGVTRVVNEYGKIIVLEDDLITSPYFLKFMNNGLNFYENNEEVISLCGYFYPLKQKLPETFFLKGADCWGWATWKRGWNLFEANGQKLLHELETQNLTYEFDVSGSYPYTQMLKEQISGKNNSWAIRWQASAFLNKKISLYPGTSLVKNIGHDGSGEHCDLTGAFEIDFKQNSMPEFSKEIKENEYVYNILTDFFRSIKVPLYKKIINKIKKIINKVWSKL